MATVWGLRLASGDEFQHGNVREYPEKAGQTFVKWDPVTLTTSGTVEDALDTEMHLGIALAAASGTTNALVPVLILNPDMLFVASQSTAGATQVTAQTMVGLVCSWIKSTITGHTAKLTVDTADTAGSDGVEIIGLDSRDAVGTADGRVLFRFLPAVIQAREGA